MGALIETGIIGAALYPLSIIPTAGGNVLKMLTPDNPFLAGAEKAFGEIYFSEIRPGFVRAWKRHKRQRQLFCVPQGLLKIGLYDGRETSASFRSCKALLLGRPGHYSLLSIPPGIWYGFACASETAALICNCADIPHDPAEMERAEANGCDAPYPWDEIDKLPAF